MQKCVDLGDDCYAVTMNTGICSGLKCELPPRAPGPAAARLTSPMNCRPGLNCWDNALPDPQQKAQEVYFCTSGQLQFGGQLNLNFASFIKGARYPHPTPERCTADPCPAHLQTETYRDVRARHRTLRFAAAANSPFPNTPPPSPGGPTRCSTPICLPTPVQRRRTSITTTDRWGSDVSLRQDPSFRPQAWVCAGD